LADEKESHWIPPRWVCEVEFREYTGQGHLRQPVGLRLRDDKRPEECVGHFDAPPGAEAAPVDSAPARSAVAAPPPDEVEISNPDKIYFPEKGLTKGDLIDYYRRIAPWMLPYLRDRPLVLTR